MRKLAFILLGLTLPPAASMPVLAAEVTTGHYVIDAMAMKPSKVNFATAYVIDRVTGLRNIATATACFNTGLHLPHGMTIKRVTVTYASGSAGHPSVAVVRNPFIALGGDDSELVSSGTLIGNGGTPKTADLSLNGSITTIDNRHYSYGFGICLGGAENDKFYSARITYSNQPPSD